MINAYVDESQSSGENKSSSTAEEEEETGDDSVEEENEDSSEEDMYIQDQIVGITETVKRRQKPKIPALNEKIQLSIDFVNDLLHSGLGLIIWQEIPLFKVKDSNCLISNKGSFDKKGYTKGIRLGARHFQEEHRRAYPRYACHAWKRLQQKYLDAQQDHTDIGKSGNFAGIEVLLHRLACGLHNGICNYPQYEASHRCNHPWCVNPKHLVWQTPLDNSDKKNCCTNANCCSHEPKCITCSIQDCAYCK